ncbi:MAG: hypothetical protein D6698_01575 [Gammaproteobacteria bacterium]|nr:MAG: hypothetical protein D6698_01575 [Gammaproteobacteria bacterium]
MQSDISLWVANLKKAYPHLPDHLTREIEQSRMEVLEPWLQRVKELRKTCTISQAIDQLIHEMSPVQVRAWQELFVCVAAQVATIVHSKWSGHKSFSLVDALNYTPYAFLMTLVTYNPYPKHKEHKEDFSSYEDGRIRLTTWVQIELPRLVADYIRTQLDSLVQESSYNRRLRHLITGYRERFYNQHGYYPSDTFVVEHLSQYYNQSSSTLHSRLQYATSSTEVHPIEDLDLSLKADSEDHEIYFNLTAHLERRALDEHLLTALFKLFYTEDPFTPQEQLAFSDYAPKLPHPGDRYGSTS